MVELEEPQAFGSAIATGIRTPLAALRASLESLAAGPEIEESTRGVLSRVLDELIQVDHCAESLIEFAQPTPLEPLRCSMRELVRSAVAALAPVERRRVWVALEPEVGHLMVDGPVLVRTLASLLERAARPGREVLLHSYQEEDVTTFAIVDDLAQTEPSGQRSTAGGSREEGLRLVLARREVDRLGGQLAISDTSSNRRVVIRLPREGLKGGQETGWNGEAA